MSVGSLLPKPTCAEAGSKSLAQMLSKGGQAVGCNSSGQECDANEDLPICPCGWAPAAELPAGAEQLSRLELDIRVAAVCRSRGRDDR